jgi:four helix bundle protein
VVLCLAMAERPYMKLIVWKEAHALCRSIYHVTKLLPQDERFGLCSQMRRASYSIPMNIAEGNMRRSKKEKSRFIEIAMGSLEELHYQCLLSKDLEYIDQDQFDKCDDHVQRVSYLLTKLRSSLL